MKLSDVVLGLLALGLIAAALGAIYWPLAPLGVGALIYFELWTERHGNRRHRR